MPPRNFRTGNDNSRDAVSMADNDNKGDLAFRKLGDSARRLRHLIFDDSRAVTLHVARLLALSALLFVWLNLEVARSDEPSVDWAGYARAVEFCRGGVERPMSLSSD